MGKRFPCTLCNYSGYDKRAIMIHAQNKHSQGSKPRTANLGDWKNQQTNYLPNKHQKETLEVIDCNEGEVIHVE